MKTKDTPLISAVMTLRNGILLGYPFVEAILAALPLCDEFVIVDGYSEDDTFYWLERLQQRYPDKIVLSREHWPKGLRSGHAIGRMQTQALKQCRGRWIYLLQADEIMAEENIRPLRELCDPWRLIRRVRGQQAQPAAAVVEDTIHLPVPPDPTADALDRRYTRDLARVRKQDALLSLIAGSYHIDFMHWTGGDGRLTFDLNYRWAVRLARNRPGLYSGLDGWLLQGPGCFPVGVARLPQPVLHLPALFPVNGWRKTINAAGLYPNHAWLQHAAVDAARSLEEYTQGRLHATVSPVPPFRLHPLVAPLIGQAEYRVRPELLE